MVSKYSGIRIHNPHPNLRFLSPKNQGFPDRQILTNRLYKIQPWYLGSMANLHPWHGPPHALPGAFFRLKVLVDKGLDSE